MTGPLRTSVRTRLAELRAARLAREDDVAALRGERRAQELRLRRLPRAVGSLERNEHSSTLRQEERPFAGRTVTVRGARPATRPRLPLAYHRARRERPRARGRERGGARRPAGSEHVRSQAPGHVRKAPALPPLRPRSRISVLVLNGNGVSGAAGTTATASSPAATATPSRATHRSSTTRVRSSCSGPAGSARPSASRGTRRSPRWRRSTAASRPSTRTFRSSSSSARTSSRSRLLFPSDAGSTVPFPVGGFACRRCGREAVGD